MFSEEDKTSMKETLITLSTVALMSRDQSVDPNLRTMILLETLRTYFNVGTENSKSSPAHDSLCPLEHMRLVDEYKQHK